MYKIDFFDFCSGIGGGRIGALNNGLNCVGHCEIDKEAYNTYNIFFNDNRNYGDIMALDCTKLPDFDFLLAGFPCQTFSIVGKREGFDNIKGQIIFSLIKILKKKNIKYFLLENVKGLINHNKGETLSTILKALNEIGYNVYWENLNSYDFGVPQKRERVYIVGFRKDLDNKKFKFPRSISSDYKLSDFLDKDNDRILELSNSTFIKYLDNKYNRNKFCIENLLYKDNLILDCRQSDLRVYDNLFPTLRTGRHGILYVKNKKLYKLNGFEALTLQGFPKKFH